MGAEIDRLARDLSSPEFLHGVEQAFWEFVAREQDFVYIRFHAPDGRSFIARLLCSDYWNEPIGCVFVDCTNREPGRTAWPDGNGKFEQWIKFRDANPFICWDQDRFGIVHHLDWKGRKAWQKQPNQIVGYVEFLRQMLHVGSRGYNCRTSNTGDS